LNMASIRRWHSYIGLLIAPSVLFFALTGAAQLFNLHEAHGNYHPAVLLEKLSSVHKDQVFELGHHHEPPDSAPSADESSPDAHSPSDPEEHSDEPALGTFVLKGYFLLVALTLTLSTAFGLWMGLMQTQRNTVGWLLVGAGSVIPVILLLL
jgi:hypothetical protein